MVMENDYWFDEVNPQSNGAGPAWGDSSVSVLPEINAFLNGSH